MKTDPFHRFLAAALLGAVVVPSPSSFAQDASEVPIQTADLGSGIAMLTGRGGNLGVSTGSDGALLIDDQFAPMTSRIEAAVKQLGEQPVRFVLNTHWHGDHTGGNENLAGAGALIFAHRNVRLRMSSEQTNAFFGRTTPPAAAVALPIVTFEDGIRFHLNGQQIDVRHVGPAHTDGDSIVVIQPANVIHMGDVYFNGFYPFIDESSGGSVDGVITAADEGLALANAETRIIPGHGPLSNRAKLAAYRDMLIAVSDAVQAGIDDGKSADEVVAAAPTASYDEQWGGGFLSPEKFTRMIYDLLLR
jgi:glyoxylase-like metal-dependent hydrolase (beta-lactamase superfamily II)